MQEVKILKRGNVYLTPLLEHHLQEVHDNLSPENKKELRILGYTNIMDALKDMQACSDCYLARRENGPFLFVGGLWFDGDMDYPQVFAMFSKNMKDDYISLARGSKMLMNFFDKTHPNTTMTILADYEGMLNWASWLGYEAVGVAMNGEHKYVEFVRCNHSEMRGYDDALRPIMH